MAAVSGNGRVVVVTGATGRQGGAVARHLLANGWRVRAVTRRPDGPIARALTSAGAEVHKGDMAALETLLPIFEGAYGAFSVQASAISGARAELAQGKAVADAARQAGISHFVYASAGPGEPNTGVLQWDVKLEVEAYIRRLGLPATVLRPMALMELMTDRRFYPQSSTWYVMPKLVGEETPIPWIGAGDVGAITGLVLARPDEHLGQVMALAGDVRSLAECQAIYRTVAGKDPSRFPMPSWLMERFAGVDVMRMWRWLRTGGVRADPDATRTIHPGVLDVEAWLRHTLAAQRS
jgi:uncharacterized protein YbjT (DUF2867 family)